MFDMQSFLSGLALGLAGKSLKLAEVAKSMLITADGYTLQDANGRNLMPKEGA